ncbi:uncharacterized protein PAN0_012d4597 [Moesziomyces antarcticus]|uniref:Related to integral membrane protein n=2 Tax=Pseudozyma antarctica TaxID=84753 RepID=A0A5C3FVT7_PSEA2|nr:uncharacterized protein PAN0_012d4597 [Moesziomyces antarcticus]GAK66375.1 integral membrane protein [Moesziomyces antarcticus]SPO48422.1 related to integral membrane protein [Moesziomyces antarcticus]
MSESSRLSTLLVGSSVFATIFIGFGVNAILRPDNALTFFEFAPPLAPADKTLVKYLMTVYGVRDIFMGLAMIAAAWAREAKTLGWICVAASMVAFADGAVCWHAGKGEWGHWSYAPMLTIIGSLLIGRSARPGA